MSGTASPQHYVPTMVAWAQGGTPRLREQLHMRLKMESERNMTVKHSLGLAEERQRVQEAEQRSEEAMVKHRALQARCKALQQEVDAMKEGQEYILRQYEELGKEYHRLVQQKTEAEEYKNQGTKMADRIERMEEDLKQEINAMENRLHDKEAALNAEIQRHQQRIRELEEAMREKDEFIRKMEGQIEFARNSLEGAVATNSKLEDKVAQTARELALEKEHSKQLAVEAARLEGAVQRGAQLYVDACEQLEVLSKTNAVLDPPNLDRTGAGDRKGDVALLQDLLKQKDKELGESEKEKQDLTEMMKELEERCREAMQLVSTLQGQLQSQQAQQSLTALPAPFVQAQLSPKRVSPERHPPYSQGLSTPATHRPFSPAAPRTSAATIHTPPPPRHDPGIPVFDETPASPPALRHPSASPVVEPLALKMQAAIAELQRLTSPVPEKPSQVAAPPSEAPTPHPPTPHPPTPRSQLSKMSSNAAPFQSVTDVFTHLAAARKNGDAFAALQAYRDDAVVRVWEGSGGISEHVGKEAIAKWLLELNASLRGAEASMLSVDFDDSFADGCGLVLYLWNSPAAGLAACSENIIVSPDMKVARQNVVLAMSPDSLSQPSVRTVSPSSTSAADHSEKTAVDELARLRRQVVTPENVEFHNELRTLRQRVIQATLLEDKYRNAESIIASLTAENAKLQDELSKWKTEESTLQFWQNKVRGLLQENEMLRQDGMRIREQLVAHEIRTGSESPGREWKQRALEDLAVTVGDIAASAAMVDDLRKQRDRLQEELAQERKRTVAALGEVDVLRRRYTDAQANIESLQLEREQWQKDAQSREAQTQAVLASHMEKVRDAENAAAIARDSVASMVADEVARRERSEELCHELSRKVKDLERRAFAAEDKAKVLEEQMRGVIAR